MNDETEKDVNGQWAIVELMGHKVVAGLASKDERFGKPLLRIDVPATSSQPAFTQFYGTDSIYCITPVSPAVAQITAEQIRVKPVSVYTPDLVTAAEHEAELTQLQKRIWQLEGRSLLGPQDDDEEEDFQP